MGDPSDQRRDAAGLQRFGLGFRAGRSGDAVAEARDRLIAETQGRVVAQPANPPFSGAAEIGGALYAFEDKERMEREARRVAMAAAQPAPAMPGAAPQNQMQPLARAPNDPPLPFRTYREEVLARVNLALDAETGFTERLVMFWSNHFCVGATKSNMCRIMAGAYEREAIRPHVLGRFEEMLIAAESHPAMLDFLDNRLSIGPGSPAGKRRGRGLNENLAREILELHTLGVSGGYGQADVTNLARIITGWTVVGREGVLGFPGSFAFNVNLQEPGPQPLLGKTYDQSGRARGVAALTDLAHHPATARFLAVKLARHFVADEPPAKLVAELAQAFTKSGGDLAVVSKVLLDSNEAWNAEATKIRSPQEFLLAAYRAYGRKPDFGQVIGPLGVMGQPFWQPSGPNGYPDSNEAWASAEGIKTRIDVAAGWGRQAANNVADPRAATEAVLGPLLSAETRQAVARAESKPQALALLLMSPEFQRR
jgi:uncharacterized protein (DUF1800 family)